MSGEPTGALRIERTVDAPAQAVFDAWTDPDVLRRWWHAEHDWETPSADVDPRIGGRIAATMRNPADGSEHGGSGTFTVFEPPRRLAFTWAWTDIPGEQLVEVEFREHAGATTVVLTNHGIKEADRADYLDGWQNSLDNLERALAA